MSDTQKIETAGDSGSDGMSAGEMQYFRSGGEDVSGLDGDAAPVQTQAPQQQDGQPPVEDDTIDGEISIDSQGRAKDKTTGRFVPHAALHKERERRKATEVELTTTREKYARVDERLALLNDIIGQSEGKTPNGQQPAPQDEVAPDPETDIFAYVKWQAKQIEKLHGQLTGTTESISKQRAEETFRSSYVNDAQTFMKATPDFQDAYQHLVKGRDAELAAMGMSDPAKRADIVAKEERALAAQALQEKRSPSQVLYNLARARGYTAKPTQQQPDANAQRVQQIARGQREAGASLSNAGGSSGDGNLTAESLSNMSDADFSATMNRLSASQRRTLLGG